MICDCMYVKNKKSVSQHKHMCILLLTCVVTYLCCYLPVGVVACVILAA